MAKMISTNVNDWGSNVWISELATTPAVSIVDSTLATSTGGVTRHLLEMKSLRNWNKLKKPHWTNITANFCHINPPCGQLRHKLKPETDVLEIFDLFHYGNLLGIKMRKYGKLLDGKGKTAQKNSERMKKTTLRTSTLSEPENF